jgi:PAS domain S-box-containing protein
MTAVKKRLEIQKGALFLTSQAGDGFELAYGYGLPGSEEGSVSFLDMGGLETKGALIADPPEGRCAPVRPDNPICRRLADRFDMDSPLLFPIAHDREILGLLVLDVGNPARTVSQSDLNVLTAVSTQLGVTIRNIRYLEELKTREEQLRMVTDNVHDVIWQFNPLDQTFEYVSPSIEPLMGYRPEEVVGTPISAYFSGKSLALVNSILGRRSGYVNNEEIPTPIEIELIRKNGSLIWAEVNFDIIRSSRDQGHRYLGIARDITERKKAETERRRLEERLQRAQRMEAIGPLAGGVAHDLNNVLSGIVGFPEMLLLELPPSSPLREPIEAIMASGYKAAAIVQDLLTLARRGVVTRKRVNLNQVIKDYLESPQFKKLISFHDRVVVETELSETLPDISGSPFHLFKVLMNIVSNAAEAMPEGGRIIVATDTFIGIPPVAPDGRTVAREWVMVKVLDNGIGIAPADLKRIFEPFYTKKVMGRSGTGLGMAVVWGTVQDHNGHIDVRSKENEFTEFTIFLPADRDSASLTREKSTPTTFQGSGEMILVVDDLKDQRVLAEKMLSRLGYKVQTAGSGEEAIDLVRSRAPDLVVLDMLMEPGIDGLETYRRILACRPGQKAIIASGFAASDRVQEAMKLGASGYIRKPYRLETLGTAVKKSLSAPGPDA